VGFGVGRLVGGRGVGLGDGLRVGFLVEICLAISVGRGVASLVG